RPDAAYRWRKSRGLLCENAQWRNPPPPDTVVQSGRETILPPTYRMMTDPKTRNTYAAARIGGRYRRGSRPAVLVFELQPGSNDPDSPVGAELTAFVLATRRLLDAARDAERPAILTTIEYRTQAEAGVWLQKMPGLAALEVGSR